MPNRMDAPGVISKFRSALRQGAWVALFVLLLSAGQFASRETARADHVPECGPMDVAFVIDDTGSMLGALANVSAGLASIMTDIDHASGGDYQLAVVSFKDTIVIHEVFSAGNAAAASADIAALVATGGGAAAEASDEALNTVVNALPAAGRPQNVDFTPAYRAAALKIAILVTDAPPGGFDDTYTPGVDDVNAHQVALDAAGDEILISAIFVPTTGDYAGQAAVMMDYAATTGGDYIMTNADGSGTAAAIQDIIEACGTGDDIAPVAACRETTNPSGKNVPKSGVIAGKSGQNPDGFYELLARDDTDPAPLIYVVDKGADGAFGTADDTEFGPFDSGTKIKYTEANGAVPSQKPGPGVIDFEIKGRGDFGVYAVDAAGNVGDHMQCHVAPPPKQ